jgi:membrane protease YdiL (CAAX protease family)
MNKNYLAPVFLGFGIAAIFWFLMFSPWTSHNLNFWVMMLLATASLITLSLVVDRAELRMLYSFKPSYILIGIIAAAFLYLVFFAGNFISSAIFNFTERQVENIYSTKNQAHQIFIGLALFLWIGPAEEIFWRGFAQRRLMNAYGTTKGFWITTAIYAFVHIWAFNFILFMAALICGMFWGWMFLRYKNVWPAIISHALWDVTIFVLLPIQ